MERLYCFYRETIALLKIKYIARQLLNPIDAMKTNIISLDENEIVHPKLNKFFFNPALPSNKMAMDPATVVKVVQVAKTLYDLLKKSKEKKKDDVGKWLLELDKKLDQILAELAEIQEQLKKIEELISKVPYLLAEHNLESNLRYYHMNIFDLKEKPDDIAIRSLFTSLYSSIQKDMLTITGKSAYYHLYDIILAFVVQYEIALCLDTSKYSKAALIEVTKAFLLQAKNAENDKSFGQILQININTRDRALEEFKPYQGPLRRFCILEKRKIAGGGGGGDPEPTEYAWKIARATYEYAIQGDVSSEFTLVMNYLGLSEERWVYDSPDVDYVMTDEAGTKDAIVSDIHNIFSRFQDANGRYLKAQKNISHYEGIIADIDKYIALLDELSAGLQV